MPSCNRIPLLRRQASNRQGGFCYYCDVRMWLASPEELGLLKGSANARRLQCTAEHLVPRADGGRLSATNIVAACAHCNHTRHKQKRLLSRRSIGHKSARVWRKAAGTILGYSTEGLCVRESPKWLPAHLI
jgi:5-methylcytosine-specific restriction endonuclease McrA